MDEKVSRMFSETCKSYSSEASFSIKQMVEKIKSNPFCDLKTCEDHMKQVKSEIQTNLKTTLLNLKQVLEIEFKNQVDNITDDSETVDEVITDFEMKLSSEMKQAHNKVLFDVMWPFASTSKSSDTVN